MAKRKGGPNKMELVREALAAGIDDAAGIVEYLSKRGAKMSSQMASNYKSSIKKKGKHGSNGRVAKKAPMHAAPAAKPHAAPAHSASSGGVMATLHAAKALLSATGSASAAKEVLDLLGK
jgi:hypothetical protein